MGQRRPPRNNEGWLARWFGPVFEARSPYRPRAREAPQEHGFGRELLYRLRENEHVWSGFRDIEIELLSAASLQDVFEIVTKSLIDRFPSISEVTVTWRDPDYELSRFLHATDPGLARKVIGLTGRQDEQLLPHEHPWLGRVDDALRQLLFPNSMRPINSAAIVPLRLRGEWVGTLNQGSVDPGHYSSEMATDLLAHLALVFGLCVENAMNRMRLQRDGLTDPLTGVANRRLFARRLQDEVSQWRRKGGYLSCLIADIDHFKEINDRYGHPVGDEVLKGVAKVLSSRLRASDLLARHGGEEFALLLPGTEPQLAAEIAERLRMDVSRYSPGTAETGLIRVTVSIGIAALGPGASEGIEDPGLWLVGEADEQLYRAKSEGRNRVVVA